MQAAVYYNNNDIRVEEVPKPVVGDQELLVKVLASGICGSDVMEWYRIKKAPLVLGHEIAGEIVEVGRNVEAFKIGDRVFVSHHVPCNTCRYCLNEHHTLCDTLRTTNFDPGGFAEYIRIPAINVDRGVFKLPDNISFDDGTFIEPVGCVVRGLRKARFKAGSTALVIGSGISGLLNIQLLKAMGAANIIASDISQTRLEAAIRLGANSTIDARENLPERVRELNNGRLADLVIVCAAAPQAIKNSMECIDRGGVLLLFAVPEAGLDIPVHLFGLWRDGITLLNTYGAAPIDLMESIELISSGVIEPSRLITDRFPLSKSSEAFQRMIGGGATIKVIIEPHS
ncbi:MAG: zinc-dependent dehydrogenase [Nitrospinota bacterium]|nr:zinc-dependent dehydrogenase [Nitrospinota bacterium]